MKRNYPLFLIDRSKAENYPFDYIICPDRNVGFIARVVHFTTDEMYAAFIEKKKMVENANYFHSTIKLKRGGLLLVAEDFLYSFDLTPENLNRVQVLLKKSLKKYLYTEIIKTPAKNLGIDNQIKQQELTIERARQNYDSLVQRANGDKAYADYQIALAEATLKTLRMFRDYQKIISSLN